MMLRICVVMLLALVASPGAMAVCTLVRGAPTTLTIGSQLMRISADAPVSTTVPIAEFDSPNAGRDIGYDYCLNGSEYGKRAMNLTGQDASTRIYQTNITGIGIKLLFSNGSAFGNFPSTSYMQNPKGEEYATLDAAAQSFYRIQFFKTSDRLRLTQPQTGDLVLPASEVGYNYVLSADPASYYLKLAIGEMRIISTPVCTTDGEKTVNFNTVTPSLLRDGVVRDLKFALVCKSDYGSYSATASMITQTPSADGTYIRVKDANGNEDRMGIRITDGNKKVMKVNGSTTEQKSSISSQGPAEFSWTATLVQVSQSAPAGGAFTAKAEIVFDIK